MKRVAVLVCCAAFAGGLFWCFPLFHVLRVKSFETAKRESSFNAAEFANTFWTDRESQAAKLRQRRSHRRLQTVAAQALGPARISISRGSEEYLREAPRRFTRREARNS